MNKTQRLAAAIEHLFLKEYERWRRENPEADPVRSPYTDCLWRIRRKLLQLTTCDPEEAYKRNGERLWITYLDD